MYERLVTRICVAAAGVAALIAIIAATPEPDLYDGPDVALADVPVPARATVLDHRIEERSAAQPVGLQIPAIGVDEAQLVDLGRSQGGTLEVPRDFARAGWYTDSSVPGEPGPAVIAGHVDSRRGPAVFYRLRDLEPDDEIFVTRSDGEVVRFVVDGVQHYSKKEFPSDAVYGPVPGNALRLITCGGTFDRSVRSYRDNVVVYASQRTFTP